MTRWWMRWVVLSGVIGSFAFAGCGDDSSTDSGGSGKGGASGTPGAGHAGTAGRGGRGGKGGTGGSTGGTGGSTGGGAGQAGSTGGALSAAGEASQVGGAAGNTAPGGSGAGGVPHGGSGGEGVCIDSEPTAAGAAGVAGNPDELLACGHERACEIDQQCATRSMACEGCAAGYTECACECVRTWCGSCDAFLACTAHCDLFYC